MEISKMEKIHWTHYAGLAGPMAAAIFTASLVGFAAARSDGYSHGRKAVSELGTVGAQHALGFNVVGFMLPGLLVVLLASVLFRLARSTKVSCIGPTLLVLSGLALVLAGVFPADMENRESFTTLMHYVGAMLSGAFWVIALFWFKPVIAQGLQQAGLSHATPWFALFLFLHIGWQVVAQTTHLVLPGWGQRFGFAGYFLWIALIGLALWNKEKRRKN